MSSRWPEVYRIIVARHGGVNEAIQYMDNFTATEYDRCLDAFIEFIGDSDMIEHMVLEFTRHVLFHERTKHNMQIKILQAFVSAGKIPGLFVLLGDFEPLPVDVFTSLMVHDYARRDVVVRLFDYARERGMDMPSLFYTSFVASGLQDIPKLLSRGNVDESIAVFRIALARRSRLLFAMLKEDERLFEFLDAEDIPVIMRTPRDIHDHDGYEDVMLSLVSSYPPRFHTREILVAAIRNGRVRATDYLLEQQDIEVDGETLLDAAMNSASFWILLSVCLHPLVSVSERDLAVLVGLFHNRLTLKAEDEARLRAVASRIPRCTTFIHAALTGNVGVLQENLARPASMPSRDSINGLLLIMIPSPAPDIAILRLLLDDKRVLPMNNLQGFMFGPVTRSTPEVLQVCLQSPHTKHMFLSAGMLVWFLRERMYTKACVLLRDEGLRIPQSLYGTITSLAGDSTIQGFDEMMCLFAIRGDVDIVDGCGYRCVYPTEPGNYLRFSQRCTWETLMRTPSTELAELQIFNRNSIFRFELADAIEVYRFQYYAQFGHQLTQQRRLPQRPERSPLPNIGVDALAIISRFMSRKPNAPPHTQDGDR